MSFFSFLEKAQKEFGELAQVVAQDAQSLVKETKKAVGVGENDDTSTETGESSSAQGTQDQAPPRPTLVPEEAIKRRDQLRAEEEERAQNEVMDVGRRVDKETSQIQETAANAAAWGDKLLKKGTMFLQQLSTDFQEDDASASESLETRQGQRGTIAAPPAASGMIERPEVKKPVVQQGDSEVVDNLLGQIGQLESAKRKLEVDVEELRGVLATSQQTEDELRSALSEKQEIFTAMNNSLQDEVKSLSAQLKEAEVSQNHTDALSTRISELEEQLSATSNSLQEEIKSLTAQLNEAQESRNETAEAGDASSARISELEEQLSAMEANAGMAAIKEQQVAAQLKSAEEKHEVEILALQEQLKAASAAQSQAEESMTGQISSLNDKCAELEKAVAMAREMSAAAEEGRAIADSARTKAEEELLAMSQRMEEQSAIQAAAKENQEGSDAILEEKSRLSSDLDRTKAELNEWQLKATAAEHDIEVAKSECDRLREEHRSKVEAMENSLAETEADLSQKLQELEEKSKMCSSLQATLEEVKNELDARTTNAEDELGPAREQLQQITKERDEARDRVGELCSEMTVLKEKICQLENTLDDMRTEARGIEDSMDKLRASKNEIESLKGELLEAEKTQMELAATKQELTEKVESLESKMQEVGSERDRVKDVVCKLEEELEKERDTAAKEYSDLKSQLDDALKQVEEEKEKVSVAEQARVEERSAEPSGGEDVVSLKEECDQLKSTVMSLHDEVSALKASENAATNRANKAEESVNTLKEEMEEMMSEYDVTIRQLRDELNEAKKAATSVSVPAPAPSSEPVAAPSTSAPATVPDDGPKSTESSKVASTWEKLSDDEGGWDEWE